LFTRLTTLAVLVVFVCIAPICQAWGDEKIGPDGFISNVGTYRLYHGKLRLRIYDDHGKLNHQYVATISQRRSLLTRFEETMASGPSELWIGKGPNWFIFVESPDAKSPTFVWFYDGGDHLIQQEFNPPRDRSDPTSRLGEQISNPWDSEGYPSIVINAPKAVRDRLPESFKQKFDGKARQKHIRSQRAIEGLGAIRVGSRLDAGGLDSFVYQITAAT
jgi:hypothetical protein